MSEMPLYLCLSQVVWLFPRHMLTCLNGELGSGFLILSRLTEATLVSVDREGVHYHTTPVIKWFGRSIPPQNRQLVVLISNSNQ